MAPCRLSHIQVALLGHMDLKEYDLGKKERINFELWKSFIRRL